MKPRKQPLTGAEPGKGHARLEPLTGLWDTSTRVFADLGSRPVEVDGSVEKSWVLGGRFIREDLAGIGTDDLPYMGLGFIGYDAIRCVYQSVWMSTGSTAMSTATGTIDPAGKVIVLIGEEIDHARRAPRRFRAELRIESADSHVLMQSYVGEGGIYVPGFQIQYRRTG